MFAHGAFERVHADVLPCHVRGDYFAVVEDVHSTCGRAARQGAQTAVADIRADPGFTPHREIAAAAGFRAVQSTPLVDCAGHQIGMVSTHFRRPHRPSDRDLRIMELFADFAGEALTRHLGQVSAGDPPDLVGHNSALIMSRCPFDSSGIAPTF